LATFRGPVSAAHFGISGRLSSREAETGFDSPGDRFVVATHRFLRLPPMRRISPIVAWELLDPLYPGGDAGKAYLEAIEP
jgi:hypothetical protein